MDPPRRHGVLEAFPLELVQAILSKLELECFRTAKPRGKLLPGDLLARPTTDLLHLSFLLWLFAGCGTRIAR